MKSLATLVNLYTSLSQNTSGANQSLGLQLMTDQHRYQIQKYFDNERQYFTTAVGGQSLTLTASPTTGDTSATLTTSWTHATMYQYTTFNDGTIRKVLYTNNSTAISWQGGLASTITSATTPTAISTIGQQAYPIPPTISKVKNSTITIGELRYVPAPIQTRAEWDTINTLPYTSDIPGYFYIYGGNVEFWPIPATSGDLITFNYQARVPDFSTAFIFNDATGTAYTSGTTPVFDYQKGTLQAASTGATTLSGTSTAWNATGKYPLNVDVSYFNLYLRADPPNGDGFWYPISQFSSDTGVTLAQPLQYPIAAGATYSIGQMPILQEDFHDLLVHEALKIYFSSIRQDEGQFKLYDNLALTRKQQMESYLGTKSLSVNLGSKLQYRNPNLYPYAQSGQ